MGWDWADDGGMQIVHEDDRLVVVAKPAGMIVHRGLGRDPVTVADLVRARLAGAPVYAVHRLDRGTSGLLIFARDADAARSMQTELNAGRVEKRYLALVRGPMLSPCRLDYPVPQMAGKERVPAVTDFQPLAHSGRFSLVEARPLTGRRHQIRRHLKHLSHPIVGDVRYGKGEINRQFRTEYGLNRLALHAWRLAFNHPNGTWLALTADVPEDFAFTLRTLGLWPVESRR